MCNTNKNATRQRREEHTRENETRENNPLNRRYPRDYWGHKLKQKGKKTVRISCVNINGIGWRAKSEKSEDIRRYMEDHQVDVMGLCELGVNWGKVHNAHTLWERTKKWFPSRRVGVAYNTTERISSRVQQGGTATLVVNEVSHRCTEVGFDDTGLGRWSWVLIKGKQRCTTRFITVYCPGKPGGPSTVNAQQLSHLQKEPISQFWDDLAQNIAKWQVAGEQLILMGDWNKDVVGPKLTQWMEGFALKELVTSMHGQKPPPTYHKGSDAIDGIFVSQTMTVAKGGYLAFGQIPGDHRGLWVDIPQREMLGYQMADIPTARARRLKLDDPRVVKKYLDNLHKFFKKHRIYKRVKKLRKEWKPGRTLTRAQAKEYEEIDTIREKGMKAASKKCRKLKAGGRRWSPALKLAKSTILFWTLILRKLRGCRVGSRRIVLLKKQIKLKENTHLQIPEAEKKLEKAYKRYKVCKKNDKELRLNYQDKLIQAKAEAGNIKAVTVLKNIQHREAMAATYGRIRSTIKQQQNGTTKVQVTTNERLKEITKKKHMEKEIIKENERKFHQTEGRCPLLHGQLYKDLGAIGDGPKVEEVLNGTYTPPPGTSEVTKSWLKRMTMVNPDKLKNAIISLQDYRKGWSKIKERTASGELHIGHFKAGVQHKEIGWVHFQMSMIPMATGYSPKRWQKGIDVMLLKEPEVYLLEKLRTIVLYEADFNQENKRLGRDAMQLALEENKIADEQFSRPGRSAQDNALCKRLAFDYFRFKKKGFALCACDLKSCYDRVVHAAASLAMQRIGVPIERIQCMFGTIQKLIHTIRTAFGLSKKSYGGYSKKYRKPPQGLGQGNGAGPSIWSILCSTVFEELRAKGLSTDFCMAISTGIYRLCGFSYVDDADLIADGKNTEQIHAKIQQMIELWDEIMEINGAAIATDKCWWYSIKVEWKLGKWKQVDAGTNFELKARDKNNIRQTLPYMKKSEAKKWLEFS